MNDWIALAVGILGIILPLLTAWLQERTKAPVWLQEWLDKVGNGGTLKTQIDYLVKAAASLSEKSPGERKAWVVNALWGWLADNKLEVPESIVNLCVEWVYQTYKRKAATK